MKKDQKSAPIVDELKKKLKQDSVSIAMPGHKSGKGAPKELLSVLGKDVFKADLSTQKGIDDRKESKQVRESAERLAADLWGAEQAYFSTNGTSLSDHADAAVRHSPWRRHDGRQHSQEHGRPRASLHHAS
jgi:arginine decarboxylase